MTTSAKDRESMVSLEKFTRRSPHMRLYSQQYRYGSGCITGLAVVILHDQTIARTWVKAPEMFE